MDSYFEVSLRCPNCQAKLKREQIQRQPVHSCAYCKLHFPMHEHQPCLLNESARPWPPNPETNTRSEKHLTPPAPPTPLKPLPSPPTWR